MHPGSLKIHGNLDNEPQIGSDQLAACLAIARFAIADSQVHFLFPAEERILFDLAEVNVERIEGNRRYLPRRFVDLASSLSGASVEVCRSATETFLIFAFVNMDQLSLVMVMGSYRTDTN